VKVQSKHMGGVYKKNKKSKPLLRIIGV
jgi:hypothetical protein